MAIEISNIYVEGYEDIDYITDLKIENKVNSHAFCFIKGILKSEDSDIMGVGTKITVKVKEDSIVLFYGLLQQISIKGLEVFLTIVSESIFLDIKKRNRSFQDQNNTYEEIISSVVEEEQKTVVCNSDYKTATGCVTYRYEETAWEFIRKVASKLSSNIYPNIQNTTPTVFMGNQSKKVTLDGIVYEEMEGEKRYGVLRDKYRRIKAYKPLSIGQKVKYKEQNYVIFSKEAKTNKGYMEFEYILSYNGLSTENKYINKNIAGLVLSGNINDVLKDEIKVEFEIDKGYSPQSLYKYSWNTIMSNMLYSMPEKGTKAFVHLYNHEGSETRAISCMRTGVPKYIVSEKVFDVPAGKVLNLTKDTLNFYTNSSADKHASIVFSDHNYINYQTDFSTMIINGNGTISSVSTKTNIQAPLQVLATLLKNDLSQMPQIKLEGTVDIEGKVVQHKALIRKTYEPFDDAPKVVVIVKEHASWNKLFIKLLVTAVVVAIACVAITLAPAFFGITAASIGKIVMGCVIAGLTFGVVSAGVQMISDAIDGIHRSIEDYIYTFVDSFCTGAILGTVGTMGSLGAKLLVTAITSSIYQISDNYIYKDENHKLTPKSYLWNLFWDELCFGAGEIMTKWLKEHISKRILQKIMKNESLVKYLEKYKWFSYFDGTISQWRKMLSGNGMTKGQKEMVKKIFGITEKNWGAAKSQILKIIEEAQKKYGSTYTKQYLIENGIETGIGSNGIIIIVRKLCDWVDSLFSDD